MIRAGEHMEIPVYVKEQLCLVTEQQERSTCEEQDLLRV